MDGLQCTSEPSIVSVIDFERFGKSVFLVFKYNNEALFIDGIVSTNDSTGTINFNKEICLVLFDKINALLFDSFYSNELTQIYIHDYNDSNLYRERWIGEWTNLFEHSNLFRNSKWNHIFVESHLVKHFHLYFLSFCTFLASEAKFYITNSSIT